MISIVVALTIKIFIWLDIFLSYFMVGSLYRNEFCILVQEIIRPFKLLTKRMIIGPFNLSSLVSLLIINFLVRNI